MQTMIRLKGAASSKLNKDSVCTFPGRYLNFFLI